MTIKTREVNPWRGLMMLFGLYLAFGIVVRSMAPLVTPMQRDLGLNHAQMGIIMGSWPFVYIPVSLFAGNLLDRFGVVKALFCGMLIIALSALFRSLSTGFYSLLLAVSLFGLGAPMISIGGPKAIAVWFQERQRGMAMGIFITGNSVGGLIAFIMTNSIVMPLAGHDWRIVFLVYGLIAVGAALLWRFMVGERPRPQAKQKIWLGKTILRITQNKSVLITLVIGFCAFVVNHGLSNWLPKILEASGICAIKSGYLAAVPAIAVIPSILLIPRVTPKCLRNQVIAAAALIGAFALIVMMFANGFFLIAALVVFGMATSCFLPLLMLNLIDNSGIDAGIAGTTVGLFFCVAEVGGVLGPAIMGFLADRTGAFRSGMLFLTCTIGCVFFLALSLSFSFTKKTIQANASGEVAAFKAP